MNIKDDSFRILIEEISSSFHNPMGTDFLSIKILVLLFDFCVYFLNVYVVEDKKKIRRNVACE